MTGEALMTQRSATAEILFEFRHAHLDGGDVVGVQEVKEFAALEAEHFCRLTLRESAFLEPAQHGRLQHFAPELGGIFTENLQRRIGNFDGDLLAHGPTILESGRPSKPKPPLVCSGLGVVAARPGFFRLLVPIALRVGFGRFGYGKINRKNRNKLLRSLPLSVKHI
jgi:hypothetical protein